MLNEIKNFYRKTKLEKIVDNTSEDVPITYTHIFYKKYPRFQYIDLPKLDYNDSQFETLLEMRESTRIFSDEAIKLEEVSKILGSCRIVNKNRTPEKRTYPSGGARFPIELYLISYNVEKLDSGAYHYNVDDNKLECLWKKDLSNRRRELISPYLDNPAATIIFTSVISRSEVKYGHKSYPLSLIEAGHMGQNIHLASAEIGLGSCSVSGFIDNSIIEILDITEDEIPIYSISIGKIGR